MSTFRGVLVAALVLMVALVVSSIGYGQTTRWCEGFGTVEPLCHDVCLPDRICCIVELGGC